MLNLGRVFRIGPFRGPWEFSERGGILLESEPRDLELAVEE
jgi:hypothetical protein